ncbi:hypothetical protein KY343_06580 [Candidatus Woesearchaeota archaeon]|nr:hypothetical protein [Candidatus Woesearchaeota archaeon]
MDELTLLLVQILKQGEPEFRDIGPNANCAVYVTAHDDRVPNRMVIHAQARSPEDLPKRLKRDSELGLTLDYFTKPSANLDGSGEPLAITIGDYLFMGSCTMSPSGSHDVVQFNPKYKVLGVATVPVGEYETRLAEGFKGLSTRPDAKLGEGAADVKLLGPGPEPEKFY